MFVGRCPTVWGLVMSLHWAGGLRDTHTEAQGSCDLFANVSSSGHFNALIHKETVSDWLWLQENVCYSRRSLLMTFQTTALNNFVSISEHSENLWAQGHRDPQGQRAPGAEPLNLLLQKITNQKWSEMIKNNLRLSEKDPTQPETDTIRLKIHQKVKN